MITAEIFFTLESEITDSKASCTFTLSGVWAKSVLAQACIFKDNYSSLTSMQITIHDLEIENGWRMDEVEVWEWVKE